ncbi:MAG: FG-GAP repeat protein, partial [Deltaproteobacteria bacterium]|nr:FG-GAP repeat protein [Candidatus Anaeroferrophillacea bacterium]
ADTDPDAATGAPAVTFTSVTDTETPVRSVTWAWTATVAGCTFRYEITESETPDTLPGLAWGDATSASAEEGDGIRYIHVQARSPGGIEGPAATAGALLDNTGPACTVRPLKPAAGYYTGAYSSIQVPFTWSVDDDTDVASCVIRVGNTRHLDEASFLETFSASGTSLTAALDISGGGYSGWWQAGAADDAGNITWSEARRIRVGISANDFDGDGYADVLAAAPYWNVNEYGHAYLFKGGASGAAYFTIFVGSQSGARLGQAANFIGDYDGDDKADFAIHANRNNGLIKVHLSSLGISAPVSVLKDGIDFGSAFAGGDFNNDGYDDLAVGAMGAGPNDNGQIFLYLGNADGTLSGDTPSAIPDTELLKLGCSLAMGDLNNDGYDDIIAGACGIDGDTPYGWIYIYFGHAGTPDLSSPQTRTNMYPVLFGFDVAAGDVNGDGYADIVLGEPGYDGGMYDDLGAFIVYQGGEEVSSGYHQFLEDYINHNYWRAGHSVACADVTGDGLADVIIGSPGYDGSGTDNGAVWIYKGAAVDEISWTAKDLLITPTQGSVFAGQCVAAGGDINGDGFNDILYSMAGYDDLQADQGGIGIVWGAATITQTGADQILAASPPGADEQLGGRAVDGFYFGRTLGGM